MNIAYIVPSLDAKGPIIVTKLLSDYFVKNGHNVIVYYFDEIIQLKFNCRTERISFKERIDFDSFDILHSHCIRPDMYLKKWRKHIRKAKIVSTLHQDTYQSFKYEYNALLAILFTYHWTSIQSHFDCVVAISNQLKQLYQKKIKTQITTIYNGCETYLDNEIDSIYLNEIKQKKEKGLKTIGTYAYITKRKGVNQIISVLKLLKDYAAVIIGDGPEIVNLKKQAIENEVAERVIFIPHQKKPYNFLKHLDVYIMPSYSEGFGLAMVEAALSRKAIVCTNLDSFHEIFPQNEALFFNADNIEELKKKIETAYSQKEELGARSFNRVNAEFRTDIMGQRHETLYKELINN